MYERALRTVLDDGIQLLIDNPSLLKKILTTPGWEDSEIADLATFFAGKGKPTVVQGYPRQGALFPLYSIVLESEQQDTFYLGDDVGLPEEDEEALLDLLEEEEKASGEPQELQGQRWSHVYGVYVYAENPDVTLAYYNVLRAIFIGTELRLLDFGLEEPKFSGMEMVPLPQYLAENLFVRKFQISCWGHQYYATAIELGRLATGRGRKVSGIHVSEQSTGVTGKVEPFES